MFLSQEDCAIQNVWLMGGLSILTSVPVTPQPVCLLCASKGHHEVIMERDPQIIQCLCLQYYHSNDHISLIDKYYSDRFEENKLTRKYTGDSIGLLNSNTGLYVKQ